MIIAQEQRSKMGRWGNELYESDSALDFHYLFTKQVERELAFLLSPEQIKDDNRWVANVLTVLELVLLLEKHHMSIYVFVSNEKAVLRWRETFLSIWDKEWESKHASYVTSIYDSLEYRKQHRAAIAERFDYLERIARYFADVSQPHPEPFVPLDYPVPFYSLKHWTDRDNREVIRVERFMSELLGYLEREIIYWLSPEKRGEAITFDVEEVWVAAHLLGFLSEIYEQSPGVNDKTVRAWRDTTIEIWKAFNGDDAIVWDESNKLYMNVLQVFERLETAAKKHPPYEW
jgi:hypothetical protein